MNELLVASVCEVQQIGASFEVFGIPKGQPRPRAFARKFGQSWQARVYDPGTAEEWKSAVAIAARPFLPSSPWSGPIELEIQFRFPRPANHHIGGNRERELKAASPYWHTAKPDADNAAKGVMDALTTLGLWADDSQVAAMKVSKVYAGPNTRPGCSVIVREVK